MNSTSTQLLAAARTTLGSGGFSEITQHCLPGFDESSSCLFEDKYSVVAIVFYESWADLKNNWEQAQIAFVELISEHISKDELKSWEGYLLLWTTDYIPLSDAEARQQIQYNTGRVRKLICSGEQLKEIVGVNTALLPLLPITDFLGQGSDENVLAMIPDLLQSSEISKNKIQTVVSAFEQHESLVEALHNFKE